MPSPPAGPTTHSVMRITMTSLTNGVMCQNVFDYESSINAPISSGDLLAALLQWNSTFKVTYLACLSPKTVLFSSSAAELHFGITPTQVFLFAPGDVGTAGTTNLPLEMAATILRNSTLKGKHGRGRFSMPAVPDTFITPGTDANTINATGVTAYGLLTSTLNLPFTGGGTTWVGSIFTRPLPPSTLVTNLVNITGYNINRNLGTARRRKPGRGI